MVFKVVAQFVERSLCDIARTSGFKIPYEVLRFALDKKEEILTEEDAKEVFKPVGISIVLILIATLIESTVTIKIAERI